MKQKNNTPLPENDSASEALQNDNQLPTRRSLLRQGLKATAVTTAAAMLGGDHVLAQTDRKQQPLILRNDELAAKTGAFHKELKGSPRLQSEFINNPSKVVAQRFLPPNTATEISSQRLNNANRVLFSIISNERFRTWAEEYQASLKKTGRIDKSQIVKDFSAAVIRYGDAALVQGIVEEGTLKSAQSSDGGGVLIAVDLLAIAWGVVIIAFAAIILLGYPGGVPQTLTAVEIRAIVDKMTIKAHEMGRSGALTESFIR